MGRSLRRVKRSKPKIIKRKKKSPFAKSRIPHELSNGMKALEEKLGEEWYVVSLFVAQQQKRFSHALHVFDVLYLRTVGLMNGINHGI
jgi:phosphoribosyl-ATP pyrophosphohydrolase